ncbi:hypothetical protein UFOVP242_71 [uncultured Caudovirales phage]|uniref:Uncharacterized protein n=1 Tax=uncultured Caudovirales phage TaxID=2100421 RepID=A0A6J7WUX1_9CAUD|nr:hypothetical protein UFOVP242_71 [uncultured Caudovirales phage]
MGRLVDSVIAYRILRMLTTPFEETDAYKLGIIDANGKELKKMSQLHTGDERNAYSILHRMVYRIKRIIEKVPVENKKLVTFAAALSLVKENYENNCEPIDLELQYLNKLDTDLTEEIKYVVENLNTKKVYTFKQFSEDAGVPITNNAGSPGVAGFTKDDIGVPKNKQPPLLTRKKVIKNV